MQRPVSTLLGAFLFLACLGQPVLGQTDRILLIGGSYRLQSIIHTMQDGFFGAPSSSSADDLQRFFDTRLRLFFDLRPTSLIRIHYQLEIGDITLGANNPPITDNTGHRLLNVGQGTGGEAGSDGINLETKNAFIDLQLPWVNGLRFRGGIFGWGDQFDWTILATDFTGLQLTYERPAFWAQLTYLKFTEGSLQTNSDDSDWFALDSRYPLTSTTTLSGSFYMWNDNTNDNPSTGQDAFQLYTGFKLTTTLFSKGRLEISGVYNYGQEFLGQAINTSLADNTISRRGLTGSQNQGFMANLHLDFPWRAHWVGLTFQYISGEEGSRSNLDGSGQNVNAFLGLFNSQYSGFGSSRFAEGGGLELITLGPLNDTTAGLNNIAVSPFFGGGYNGRILGVLRAKIRATPVLFIYTAIGLDLSAQPNGTGDRFRGAEISGYVHWDLRPKLWLRIGAAYMSTGNWWKNNSDIPLQGFPHPIGLISEESAKDIFQLMMRLQYDFG